ncbi:MAG: hypothetical protein Q4C71_02050 [Microbacteriaceae bacterium]|nr:hypothetical protein [Microbacteriaceae bacterium]
MRVGTSWAAGAAPPDSVPAELLPAIQVAETALPADIQVHWQLTWLEGKPRLTCDGENYLTLDSAGHPVWQQQAASASEVATDLGFPETDDWL